MRTTSLIIPAFVGFTSLAAAQTETSAPAATTPASTPTPTPATSPTPAATDPKAADAATKPKGTDVSADSPGTVAEKPAVLDAGLRTFAGPCIIDPVGKEQQALPLLGAALGGFIPQIASAAIDALTNALDKAGQDQVVSITAVLPLENRPRCIQVTRGVTMPSSQAMNGDQPSANVALKDAIRHAPFLVEFLIRTARDGTAISVMPTVLRYSQSLDGKYTGGRARDIYATLTFTNVGSSDTASASVPLGSYKPDPKAEPHYFDPVSEPNNPIAFYPAGAAASPWIKSPYVVDASVPAATSDTSGTVATPAVAMPPFRALGTGTPPARTRTGGTAPAQAAGAGRNSRNAGDGYGGTTNVPQPVGRTTAGTTTGGATTTAAPAGPSAVTAIRVGDEIRPITISITFRETKPGSAFARALSGILKGNKSALVDAVDPAKEKAARTASLTAWQTNQSGYATALGDYYKKRATYCKDAKTSDDLVGREPDGADVLIAEIALIAAGRTAGVTDLPFTKTVDPAHPDISSSCGVTS